MTPGLGDEPLDHPESIDAVIDQAVRAQAAQMGLSLPERAPIGGLLLSNSAHITGAGLTFSTSVVHRFANYDEQLELVRRRGQVGPSRCVPCGSLAGMAEEPKYDKRGTRSATMGPIGTRGRLIGSTSARSTARTQRRRCSSGSW